MASGEWHNYRSPFLQESKAKLVIGTIYILLGMAILAMCFNLMQEKIVVQIRKAARRLGLIRPTRYDDIDDLWKPDFVPENRKPGPERDENRKTLAEIETEQRLIEPRLCPIKNKQLDGKKLPLFNHRQSLYVSEQKCQASLLL